MLWNLKNSVKKQAIAYKKLYTEKLSKSDERLCQISI